MAETLIKLFSILAKTLYNKFKNPKLNQIKIKFMVFDLLFPIYLKNKTTFIKFPL